MPTQYERHSEPFEPLPPVPYDPELIDGMEMMRQLFEPEPLRPDNIVWSREHVDRIIRVDADPLAMTPDAPVDVRETAIEGIAGNEILLTIVSPRAEAERRPGVYVIHGGGMVLGNRAMGVGSAVQMATRYGAVAVSVEYRLAPEHPYPAAVEDCYAGLVWFAEHAVELGFDPDRILVMGSSAGGGLSAAMGLLARDRQHPRLLGQLLDAPMIDDRNQSASTRQFDLLGVWDRNNNHTAWDALLPGIARTEDVPIYAAPNRATELAGLPKTFIEVGAAEIFREEAIEYATKIWAAGGDCELHVWSGAHHGFSGFSPGAVVSQAANAARDSWLRRLFA